LTFNFLPTMAKFVKITLFNHEDASPAQLVLAEVEVLCDAAFYKCQEDNDCPTTEGGPMICGSSGECLTVNLPYEADCDEDDQCSSGLCGEIQMR
jgi:hypothetical protein